MERRCLTATLNNIGTCLHRMGRYEDANESYRRAIEAAKVQHGEVEGDAAEVGDRDEEEFRLKLTLAQSEYEQVEREGLEHIAAAGSSTDLDPLDLYDLDSRCIPFGAVPKPLALPVQPVAELRLPPLCTANEVEHRDVAAVLFNMGLVQIHADSSSSARRLFDMAKAALPMPLFPAVAIQILNCVAMVQGMEGNGQDAMDTLSFATDMGRQLPLQHLGRYSNSEGRVAEENLGITPEECYALSQSLTGRICYQNGDYDRAFRCCSELIEDRCAMLGVDHIEVAVGNYNCGLILYEMGRVNDAIEHCYPLILRIEKSWKQRGRQEVETRQVAIALQCVGVMEAQHRVTSSVRLLTMALEAWTMAVGPHHVDVAVTAMELGKLKSDMGLNVEALMLYNDALRIYRAEYGNESMSVASILCQIGLIHYSRGELDEAMVVFDEAIHLGRASSTSSTDGLQKFTTSILETMGNIHVEKGEVEEAMEKFADAARIRASAERNNGQEAVDTSIGMVATPSPLLLSAALRMRTAAAAA